MSRSQKALAGFFTFAGVMHFVIPRRYEAIVPEYVPLSPEQAVVWSGVAEIAGGVAVAPGSTRRVAGPWLIALLLAVFPANLNMAVHPERIRGLDTQRIPRWLLWARLPLQPLMMIWAWRATRN